MLEWDVPKATFSRQPTANGTFDNESSLTLGIRAAKCLALNWVLAFLRTPFMPSPTKLKITPPDSTLRRTPLLGDKSFEVVLVNRNRIWDMVHVLLSPRSMSTTSRALEKYLNSPLQSQVWFTDHHYTVHIEPRWGAFFYSMRPSRTNHDLLGIFDECGAQRTFWYASANDCARKYNFRWSLASCSKTNENCLALSLSMSEHSHSWAEDDGSWYSQSFYLLHLTDWMTIRKFPWPDNFATTTTDVRYPV